MGKIHLNWWNELLNILTIKKYIANPSILCVTRREIYVQYIQYIPLHYHVPSPAYHSHIIIHIHTPFITPTTQTFNFFSASTKSLGGCCPYPSGLFFVHFHRS